MKLPTLTNVIVFNVPEQKKPPDGLRPYKFVVMQSSPKKLRARVHDMCQRLAASALDKSYNGAKVGLCNRKAPTQSEANKLRTRRPTTHGAGVASPRFDFGIACATRCGEPWPPHMTGRQLT